MEKSIMQSKPQVLQELLKDIGDYDYSFDMMYDTSDECYFLRISDKKGGFPVIGPTLMKHIIKSGLEFFIAGGAVEVYPRPMFL